MALPFQPHSDTSADAADLARAGAATQRDRVLAAIRGAGEAGLTDEELQQGLELHGSTERPRRIELVERGLIQDSGRRRATSTGRQAAVWVACWPGQQLELL